MRTNIDRKLIADLTKGAEENLNVALKWGTKKMQGREESRIREAVTILKEVNKTLKR